MSRGYWGKDVIDFFIAGVQKAGTTALHSILRTHPDVAMSKPKEIHFFDDETLDWSNPDYRCLRDNFPTGERRLKGEATPIYSYWPKSLERIRNHNPRAKIIILLRHPSFRAHSHWRMETLRGNETLSFDQAISQEGRARVREAPGGVHRVFSYVERGLYRNQIERLLSLFQRDQVLFLRTDALWLRPDSTIAAVESFLGISKALTPSSRYVASVGTRRPGEQLSRQQQKRDTIGHQVREQLHLIFREDIRLTARYTGLDLSDWLRLDYLEAMDRR